jgi:hypothetical protein
MTKTMAYSKLRIICALSTLWVSHASKQLWFEKELERKSQQLRRVLPTHQRLLHSIAEAACEEDAERNEELLEDIGLACECKDHDDGVVLVCMDECAYCNDDQSVCGVQSAQALYEHDTGDRVAIGGVFDYVVGRKDTLAVENLECVEENDQIVSCESCNVYVNGEQCNSCEIMDCPDGSQAELMDCENIEEGASFNFCEEVTIEDGAFQALSTNDFEECLPIDLLGSKKGKKGSKKGSKKSKKGSKSGADTLFNSSASSYKYSKSAKKASSRRGRGLARTLA